MSDLTIGIDLGTTNSCVSVLINKQIKILENESGGRITPSFIYFQPDGGIVIGEHARKMAVSEPKNGIYEMKRLVGRKFDDTQLQRSLNYFPFNISADSSNDPLVCFQQKGSIMTKTPQELYTILLKQLKKCSEDKLGQTVNKAVITVPAYFNVTQREVTLAAAKEAGFTVLKLLNEPTAAALAYYYEMEIKETHRSLVYDLGGGTFDVAILERRSDHVEVICVAGDTQLGGHDLDKCILEFIYQLLKDQYDYDPNLDSDDKRRLRNKCEEAKKELSTADAAVITINGMVPNHPKIKITLTRQKFENMTHKFFQRTIDILDKCLSDSKFPKSLINEVILCGGSTRIPKIQEMVSNYFDGKHLNKFVNPDECVAEGAALQAAMLSENKKQQIEHLEMVDVVPLSIGFDSMCNKMIFTIKRGTRLPASACHVFVNTESHETVYKASIYEGERSDVRKNRHLGTITIDNVSAAPPGQQQVILTLRLDLNGILTAKAEEKFHNNIKELKIDHNRGDRSDSDIRNTIQDAAENKEVDERFLEFVKLKSYLIKYCVGVVYNLENKDLPGSFRDIYNFCTETKFSARDLEMDDEERVKELIEECKRRCEPFVHRYNFEFMPLAL